MIRYYQTLTYFKWISWQVQFFEWRRELVQSLGGNLLEAVMHQQQILDAVKKDEEETH